MTIHKSYALPFKKLCSIACACVCVLVVDLQYESPPVCPVWRTRQRDRRRFQGGSEPTDRAADPTAPAQRATDQTNHEEEEKKLFPIQLCLQVHWLMRTSCPQWSVLFLHYYIEQYKPSVYPSYGPKSIARRSRTCFKLLSLEVNRFNINLSILKTYWWSYIILFPCVFCCIKKHSQA